MLERILKTCLVVMLMVLFMQQIVQPSINEAIAAKSSLGKVRASLQHMASNDPEKIASFLRTEKQMIEAYLTKMNEVLPDYQATRVGAIGNLEVLREKFYGNWQIEPSTQPLIEETIVRWPVRLVYESDFQSTLKVLQSIEQDLAMNRIISIDFNTGKTAEIELVVNLELLFRKSQAQISALGLTEKKAGDSI